MREKIHIKPATLTDFFKNWPCDWPEREHYVREHDVKRDQFQAFKTLLAKPCGERQIERFLSSNKEAFVLLLSLFATGHHAAWVFPKIQLRPPSDFPGGLIPDYVLAGANSSGVSWFIVELKSPNKRAFVKEGKRVFLSSDANKGICQLLNYIDLSSRSQSYLRDEIRLAGFREPTGVLLIGTEAESEDPDIKAFKGAWNRINPKIQIRSFNAVLRQVERKLNDFGR